MLRVSRQHVVGQAGHRHFHVTWADRCCDSARIQPRFYVRYVDSNEPDHFDCSSKDNNYGYNAATGEYGDMLKMGILDPTKVTRTALQNAVSVAGLLITTEAMVAELPKEEAPAGGGGGMGGMEGMM